MRLQVAIAFIGALITATEVSAGAPAWEFVYRPTKAEYVLYGGFLGDTVPPTKGDSKISLLISGSAARDMFNALGPDQPDACGADASTRVREKEDISCLRYSSKNYVCYVGLDLKTGKSIGGVIC